MPLSLHAAVMPGWQQTLRAVRGLLDKAEAHCNATGLAHADLLTARLIDDMLPFNYQVKSCVVHSLGAIEGLRHGTFSPDMTPPPESFAGLAERIDAAMLALSAVTPDELEALSGKAMLFTMGEKFRIEFVTESFLLTFSQPNFYFHATTAYNLLRMKGVPIGKGHFLARA